MEEYNKIYPGIDKRNPLKTATPSAFNNLAGFLRDLEKGSKTLRKSQEKVQKMLQTYCREPAHYQELFRFCLSGVWSWNSFFWGWPCSLAASLGGSWSYFVEF